MSGGPIRMTGAVQLHLGDCMNVMRELSPVDMILADLPYGTTRCRWDVPLPLDQLWQLYSRLCDGPILLFAQTPFDKVLGVSNLEWLRYEWIWEKTEPTGHLNAKRAPMKAHENILVFYRRAPKYRPVKTQGHSRKTAVRHTVGGDVYGAQRSGSTYDSTERYPRSVIRFSTDKQTSNFHPTQKPVALLEYLIRTYSDAGDVVLDNVMGSGSAGIAAVRTGRRFIGIEQDPKYFEIAQQRIDEALVFA